MTEALPGGGIELAPAEIEALDTRWSSCWSPDDVSRRLAGVSAPWYVAAGWALDLFLGRQTREHADTWICRRDDTIRLHYRDIIQFTRNGIPYLVPELVLLFKAKHARRKDQADFEAAVPQMTPAQRETLAGLLARAQPGHRWLAEL